MKKKIFMAVVAVIEIVFCIICVKGIIENRSTIKSYQLIETEKSFRAAVKEGTRKVVVINAPLSGNAADDETGYLSKHFDIPSDTILYVAYQKEKCHRSTDDEGHTSYEWKNDGPMTKYVSDRVYIYNDLPLMNTLPYTFLDNTEYYYPDYHGNKSGNIRYQIHYLTSEDKISFVAETGDNTYRLLDEIDGRHFVVNADYSTLLSRANDSSVMFLIFSAIICLIIECIIYFVCE